MAHTPPTLERRVEILEALYERIEEIAVDLKAGQETLRNTVADHSKQLDAMSREVSLMRADVKEIRTGTMTLQLEGDMLQGDTKILKSQVGDLTTGQQRLEAGMSTVLEKLDLLIER